MGLLFGRLSFTEVVAEHGQSALRLRMRNLILKDVPVLDINVGHADLTMSTSTPSALADA
jgi:hypothetical protein